MEHYQAALLRYAARLVDGNEAVQDVVQDSFIRLYRRWREEIAPGPAMAAWLYRTVHNTAVDYLRGRARRRELHARHFENRPAWEPPHHGAALALDEDALRARAALQTLSLRERELVLLKVYEELSYRDISRITGLTTGNVGFILHRAMKKLAEELRRTGAA